MPNQSLFPATEWRTLQFAVLWVFGAVAAADGNIDKREVEALAKELSQAHLYKEPLARDVLLSLLDDFENIFNLYQRDSRNVVQGLIEVANVLDRKVPPQVAYNFKGAMLMIGFNVSESTGKGFLGSGQKSLDQKHKALDAVAIIMRFSLVAPSGPVVAIPPTYPSSPPKTKPAKSATPVATKYKPSKRTSVYFLIDSSRHISDIAYLLDDGLRRLPDKLRSRPQRGIQIDMSLILAGNTGRVVTQLTNAETFSAPSLLGRGKCNLGQALQELIVDVKSQRIDGKPLIIVVLAGSPEDNWETGADQLCELAKQNKANVFVLGVGGYSDASVLKRLTPNFPLVMADVTQDNLHKSFDWLYSITDIILTGMESGVSGQRRDIPAPPACMRIVQ